MEEGEEEGGEEAVRGRRGVGVNGGDGGGGVMGEMGVGVGSEAVEEGGE